MVGPMPGGAFVAQKRVAHRLARQGLGAHVVVVNARQLARGVRWRSLAPEVHTQRLREVAVREHALFAKASRAPECSGSLATSR